MNQSLEGAYRQYRPLLFSIAYRMLGSAADAEELVQDTFVRAQTANDNVAAPKAYLTTILTRLCLDHLKSAAVQRTEYVGPWLPEPVATRSTIESDPESVSMAFLLILESLTPIERAVFLLRSVFEYEFKEIAEITGKTEVNIRQIFHRARQNVHSRRPRFSVPSEQGWAVAGRFQQACATGNIGDLLAVLSPEVTLVSDGGGKAAAALRPIYGSDRVSRFIFGVLKKYEAKEVATTAVELNGAPAFLFYADGELLNALVLETDGRSISSIYIVRNPEKLTSLRQMPADPSKQNDPRFVN